MNRSLVDKIATAVLYEGYILYPYRPSVKSQHRWTFGGLYPRAYAQAHPSGDAWSMQIECIALGSPESVVEVSLRFLHLSDRTVGRLLQPMAEWPATGDAPHQVVPSLAVGTQQFRPWQEAVEREVAARCVKLGQITEAAERHDFAFPAGKSHEPLNDDEGRIVGVLIREQQPIEGTVEISAQPAGKGIYRLLLKAWNRTPVEKPESLTRDDGLMRALVSTHAILNIQDGAFVSLTDPPPSLREQVSRCRNIGVWPVLVGEVGERDTLLASPIILEDYPRIAPESPGDLFDATEIDEILTLRVLTLTDGEKREAAAVDPRADAMLKRTEALAREQLMGLHGVMRGLRPIAASEALPPGDVLPAWDVLHDQPKLPSIRAGGVELRPGDRVRLCPRRGADAIDLVLAGKTATIASIEQDFEDRIHVAVTVDEDPGADFGMQGKPGHRFFFSVDEVEALAPQEQA